MGSGTGSEQLGEAVAMVWNPYGKRLGIERHAQLSGGSSQTPRSRRRWTSVDAKQGSSLGDRWKAGQPRSSRCQRRGCGNEACIRKLMNRLAATGTVHHVLRLQ